MWLYWWVSIRTHTHSLPLLNGSHLYSLPMKSCWLYDEHWAALMCPLGGGQAWGWTTHTNTHITEALMECSSSFFNCFNSCWPGFPDKSSWTAVFTTVKVDLPDFSTSPPSLNNPLLCFTSLQYQCHRTPRTIYRTWHCWIHSNAHDGFHKLGSDKKSQGQNKMISYWSHSKAFSLGVKWL